MNLFRLKILTKVVISITAIVLIKNYRNHVRFEVFTAVRMMVFIWVLAPCRLVYTAPKPRSTTSVQRSRQFCLIIFSSVHIRIHITQLLFQHLSPTVVESTCVRVHTKQNVWMYSS
jgi:hypothetical protein